ncbi:MAG: glycosyltransferase family 4 protein [Muribaculum sp.]|nr:glycosyltransferase family 4 protein [Muribaculum sp.]
MKVLFILHETSIHNGSWRAAHGILSGLKSQGIDLLVVCPGKQGAYETLRQEDFNVVSIKYIWYSKKAHLSLRQRIEYVPRALRRYVLNWRWMILMKKICKQYRPDIIHSNSSVITNGYKLSKSTGIPHVWHVREYGDLDFSITIKEANKLLQCNKYSINVTEGIRSYRHEKFNPELQKVIYDGVYPSSHVIDIMQKDKYFLFVGSLNEGKGIKDLLIAWKDASDNEALKSYKLLVCGGKADEIKKWEKFSKSNLVLNVEWLGRRDDVDKLMQKARAVIVPSHFEAFGFVMPEAIANGSLVIGRDTAGTKEQFDNGVRLSGKEIGLRFNSATELTQLLVEVASNEAKNYNRYIEAGQYVFKQLYTTEANVNGIISFYSYILKQEQPS